VHLLNERSSLEACQQRPASRGLQPKPAYQQRPAAKTDPRGVQELNYLRGMSERAGNSSYNQTLHTCACTRMHAHARTHTQSTHARRARTACGPLCCTQPCNCLWTPAYPLRF